VQLAQLRLSVFSSTWLQNMQDILLTVCSPGTTQKLSCPVGTAVELKNVRIPSYSTGTILSQNIPRYMPLLSDVVVIFLC